MIISHRKKFAFFANIKTGSKAVGTLLRTCGDFDARDVCSRQPYASSRTMIITHPGHNVDVVDAYTKQSCIHFTPTDAIKWGLVTLEQLREYQCFAFFRDPEARHYAGMLVSGRS